MLGSVTPLRGHTPSIVRLSTRRSHCHLPSCKDLVGTSSLLGAAVLSWLPSQCLKQEGLFQF